PEIPTDSVDFITQFSNPIIRIGLTWQSCRMMPPVPAYAAGVGVRLGGVVGNSSPVPANGVIESEIGVGSSCHGSIPAVLATEYAYPPMITSRIRMMPIAIVRGLASDWLVLGIGVSPLLQEVPETRMFP